MYILRASKAEKGVLDNVFRIATAAKHAIGEPKQAPAMGRQGIAVTRPV
jgi:hypothetical protein